LYIVITILLGFSAVNTGNNMLFLVVSGLLAFMSVTGLAGMLNLQRLSAEVIAPEDIFAGREACFRIRIENRKRLHSFLITVKPVSGGEVTLPVVPAAGYSEADLKLVFPERGHAGIESITISSTFPVNFFTRYWTIPVNAAFLVYPALIPAVEEIAEDTTDRIGSHACAARGMDGEIEGIADYSGREPLRLVHWKHTARGDEIVVKQFGSQVVRPMLIDLDKLAGGSLESRLSKAAWLVMQLIDKRPVGLRLDENHIIAPETGARHRALLMAELALYGKH